MALPPKKPPPYYVNYRGEPIGGDFGRTAKGANEGSGAQEEAVDHAPDAADLDTVADALCLAGCLRSKTWLLQFLRALGRKTAAGKAFSSVDVDAALRALRATGRVHERPGQGLEVPAATRLERLPALLQADASRDAWKAWARASASHPGFLPLPPKPEYRQADEVTAMARLALAGGLNLEGWNEARRFTLGLAADIEALPDALMAPFVPAMLERMQPDLRQDLLTRLAEKYVLNTNWWQPLMAWLDPRLATHRGEFAPMLREAIAERRLHAGDLAGCYHALDGLQSPRVALLRAAQQAWAGDWQPASVAFASALKEAAKQLKAKRNLMPQRLLQWAALSLLAQPDPTAWAAAQKFCIAESGTRTPVSSDPWGLWAYAAAVRLGDATLDATVFAAQRWETPATMAQSLADRLLLAAWLGHVPVGWPQKLPQELVRALHAEGLAWKADLVRQACARVGWPVPPREPSDPAPWPTSFYGRPQEAWRDALAVIETLADKSTADPTQAAAATLQWQLTLDDDHRVMAVEPFERVAGARGLGKPKPVPLSRIKKAARLDPRDAAVARCIDTARWSNAQLAIDVTGATVALAGHPAVVFSDAPGQLVELREAMPVLEVQRQQVDGEERFVFQLADPLLASRLPAIGERFTSHDPTAEAERRNTLRVLRDSPDSARLLRISPAQRRVAELVAQQWSVPVSAKAELDSALRVLAGHFQLHSDAAAGEAVASEPRLRAQLSPLGDGLQLRLLVQPFGSFGPTLAPGSGRARLMTLHEGLGLSTERDLALERSHLASVLEALPFLGAPAGGDASWLLDDPEQALAAVEQLPQLPAVAAIDWPRGKPVRVIPVASGAMQVAVASGADWFAVTGEVRIDEQRVLSLQQLMQLADASRRSRFVALGAGEYLALTEQLRQQLADLQALGQADKSGLKLPAAAASWLADTLDGHLLQGDKTWRQRLARLDEAAALDPQPPAALQAQLRGYQAEGFAWMARLAHAGLGACLADDMGLGKTVQTLALLLHRADQGPALVIAPTSVCGNWVAEAARFAPGLRVRHYGDGARQGLLEGAGADDLVVVSYALAQIDVEAFAAVEWSTLVLDEAQALKNAATKRAKSVATLQAGFRLALTGTPVENRLADLWSILNLLNPGLLGSSTQFSERFANAIERSRDDGARQRLRRLVSPFLLRRTKAQVLTDLPPRTEIIHRVEPGPEERSFLEAARRSAIERVAQLDVDADSPQAGFHVLAELTRLRRAACDPRLVAPELGLIGAKVQEFEQLASELVAGRHKALVFSQFTDFLKLLGERLQAAGIRYQYLDGSTPGAERSKRVAAFQRGEGDLFLISLKAGGFGLNLTAADYVLIVDPWWNPAAEDQAMGRAHRIGQQRPVTVYRLVTAGSIEERIIELHRDKRSLADGILEGQDGAAPLGADALRALLQDV